MGMFDIIKCEISLPDGSSPENREFQTKSLENVMAYYVITAKGELYEERWDVEWVEENTRWLGGYMRNVEGTYRREYLTDFHGDIIFYDSQKIGEVWRDYYARFTDGRLTRMWYKDCNY